jgi:ubiquitin carboxyl-terminal hydrolase 34
MRSKINDHFEFPMEIDMTPYDVKYLKDTTQNLPPDKFNLVGVLIHTGNAEAGHYYSYIKERNGKPHSWVEFNDADVTTFDLGTLQESSFGGLGEPNFGVRYTRAWNAYMLFYERATVSAANGGQLGQSVDQPVHVTMPRELFLPVAQNNKEFIRKFCMFDPEHSKYVRLLLDQYRLSSKGECSDDHRLEKRVIQCALMQVEQVLSRMKDCADLDYAVLFLSKMTLKCSTCCYIFLEVLANTGQIFRNLLLRNVSEDFRRKVVKLVSGALYYLRCADTRAYGFDVDDLDQCSADDVVGQMSGALQLVLKSLKEMHTFVYSHQSRSCQEYFDLLVAISRFGLPDAWLIHNYGFLACCLETLVVEEVDPHLRKLKAQSPYIAYLRRVDKGNSPPLQSLVVLTALILDHMDFERELDVANADLEHFVMRRALTRHEQSLLAFNTEIRDRGNHVANVVFLCKALEQDRENSEAAQHIVRILIQNMPRTHELYWNIFSTICTGVNIEPAWQAKPFLDAALVFMQHCEASEDGVKMIDRIATEVSTIGDYGGMEHLEFLKKASDIRNTNFVDREDYAAYLRAVRRSLPVWAIHLLTYHEYDVRVKTKQFLLDMFQINEEVTINADEAQEIKGVAIAMVNACNRWFRMTTRTCSQIEVARILELEQVFLFCLQEFVEPDSPLQNEGKSESIFATQL